MGQEFQLNVPFNVGYFVKKEDEAATSWNEGMR